MKNFKNKILLVTGGTGSFGNAVVQKFLNYGLKEIRIFSRDEKKQDDMRKHYKNEKLKFYLGDVREKSSIDFAMKKVDYVFHAAALKQVPSCEFYPLEAINTNILGANNVISSVIEHGVKKAIFLSTDKAVYPINSMGMSKALMEKIVIARSRDLNNTDTVICATRYGNVMASRGSVIPLFFEQIKKNKSLTITSPNMTRFLMSLEESVELVLEAFKTGNNGEIFVDDLNIIKTNTNWSKKVAYIPQTPFFLNGSIIENITFFSEKKIIKRKVINSLKNSGLYNSVINLPKKLNTIIGEDGNKLSTGQLQRLSIARALYLESDLIICDEATNSLDAENEKVDLFCTIYATGGIAVTTGVNGLTSGMIKGVIGLKSLEENNIVIESIKYFNKCINVNLMFWPAYEKLFSTYEKTNKLEEYKMLLDNSKTVFTKDAKLVYYDALYEQRINNHSNAIELINSNDLQKQFINTSNTNYLISLYDLLSKTHLKLKNYEF